MKCNICGSSVDKIFNQTVLKKYKVDYFKCSKCGFIQTQKPTWLKEAYNNSITNQDTGLIKRNIYFANLTSPILKMFFKKDKKFLDYAGGYGLFTKLMREKGLDFYWSDPYTKNIYSKGFEYNKKDKIEAITCFECFEHFDEPIKEIEKILKISKNIIFSTTLQPSEIPKKNWDYYGFEHGQHIAFYSKQTLEYLAKKYKLNLYSINNLHIFSIKKVNKYLLYSIILIIKLKNKVFNKII